MTLIHVRWIETMAVVLGLFMSVSQASANEASSDQPNSVPDSGTSVQCTGGGFSSGDPGNDTFVPCEPADQCEAVCFRAYGGEGCSCAVKQSN
jgi:hypothetical protein